MVFCIFLPTPDPEGAPNTPPGPLILLLGAGFWRVIVRTLRRVLYTQGLERFVSNEVARILKDARDRNTGLMLNARQWVAGVGLRSSDPDMAWRYRERAYGLNYFFGRSNQCIFCQRAGETD